ncbi:aminopeptidase, partial [Acinetobacter baumannii]|nr:aminopeptidase [Acinetobacter baumannii]
MAAPITENRLRAYARLIVEAGCALRKGQDLYVRAGIESAPLVRLIVEEAYKAGSHHVTVWFRDEAI